MKNNLEIFQILFCNILRKWFQRKIFNFKIHAYYRDVDDTFLIIPKNMIKETLENINSYYSRSKFTYELEFENTLSFLNLLIMKKKEGEGNK